MNSFPKELFRVLYIALIPLLLFSCTKDSDLFMDAVFEDAHEKEIEGSHSNTSESSEDDSAQANSSETSTTADETSASSEGLVTYQVEFVPTQDAYIQGTKIYDQEINRIEEGNRKSLLKFDLDELNNVEATITNVELIIEVAGDDGSGVLDVFRGLESDWNETSATTDRAPENDILLGQTDSKNYAIGHIETISLSSKDLLKTENTLIVTHRNGNDLAFASKEHPGKKGPKLKITYEAPEGSQLEGNADTATDQTQTDNSTTDTSTDTTEEETQSGSTNTNEDVYYWKNLFDQKWSEEKSHAVSLSKSRNLNQEYYYLGYYIDGLTSMWQASGDTYYLDEAIALIDNTIDDAISVGGGFVGWPSATSDQHALWDSFYWRHVATMMRFMNQSSLSAAHKAKLDELIVFSEKNIWDRYEDLGVGNFYRSRTHMASHWARIGMELYLITGKPKYKEVFDNISFGTMEGRPSNLRNQMYTNPNDSQAVLWDKEWGVSKGSSLQDSSHAGAIISFIVAAHENGMYWGQSDIDALIHTFDNYVWPEQYLTSVRRLIDGSGGDIPSGRVHEWLPLGRYDQALQAKIREHYVGQHVKHYGSQVFGIAAMNAKILNN